MAPLLLGGGAVQAAPPRVARTSGHLDARGVSAREVLRPPLGQLGAPAGAVLCSAAAAALAAGASRCRRRRPSLREARRTTRRAAKRGRGFGGGAVDVAAAAPGDAAGARGGRSPGDELAAAAAAAARRLESAGASTARVASQGPASAHRDQDVAVDSEPVVQALKEWLKARGSKGVDTVEFLSLTGPGLRLREAQPAGAEVIVIPRNCWVSVPWGDEPELELAWALLQERWLGPSSEFAPYVDFLWSLDLRAHPLFWEEDEVAWLRASPGAHELLLDLREKIAERVAALAARARSPSSSSSSRAPPPQPLLSGPPSSAALEAEVRRALCIVEARGIQVDESSLRAALIPLVDHIRHDSSSQPLIEVGRQEGGNGSFLVVATKALDQGLVLARCFEAAGAASLLAHYAHVPLPPPGATDDEILDANVHASVALPVRVKRDAFREDLSFLGLKLDLLAERAGLDLRDGAPPAAGRLDLPADVLAGGRLLPVARFLVASVLPSPGQSEAAACEAMYSDFFQGPDAPHRPAPLDTEDLQLEVFARATAWEWCETALKRYQKAADRLLSQMASLQQVQAFAEEAAAPISVGDIVLAHYKAKGARGAVKSKQPREACVQAVSGDHITVQFLANGVRHEVPADWVLGRATEEPDDPEVADIVGEADPPRSDAPGGGAVDAGVRMARARLAAALLQAEAAVVEVVYDMTASFVKLGHGILQDRQTGKLREANELAVVLQKEWDMEQEDLRRLRPQMEVGAE